MPDRRLPGRIRFSTALLVGLFLVTVVIYVWVRPEPASVVRQKVERARSVTHTRPPVRRSPTPEPTVGPSPSPSPSSSRPPSPLPTSSPSAPGTPSGSATP